MHKGIMLIVKSNNREEALEKTKSFLKEYKNHVWDWYAVGGRWTQTLNSKHKKFCEWASKYLKEKSSGNFISTQDTKDSQQPLQEKWKKMGLYGQNPYADHYELPEQGGFYDIVPLENCLSIVKEWQQGVEDAKRAEEEAKKWLNGERGAKDNYSMYGYCLKGVASLYHQDFCFDTNVFNVEVGDYSIPKDVKGFFVVMIDIHN